MPAHSGLASRAIGTIVGIALAAGVVACGGAGAATPLAAPSDSAPIATAPLIADPSGLVMPIPTLGDLVTHTPTRVRVAALGIDLPVIGPPPDPTAFPLCDVASYLTTLATPGEPGATYLYAHARPGMFLPILTASLTDDGRSMLGDDVEIYTDDDLVFRYEIVSVRRHLTSLDFAYLATTEEAVLQTSEGPRWTLEKVAVVARPVSHGPANDADAHPAAHPRACG